LSQLLPAPVQTPCKEDAPQGSMGINPFKRTEFPQSQFESKVSPKNFLSGIEKSMLEIEMTGVRLSIYQSRFG
jgi:hypothetical protein